MLLFSCLLLFFLFTSSTAADNTPHPDPRPAQLAAFFKRHKCPAQNYGLITEYISSADRNHIPFTLLPSISVQESSCLQHYRLNNPFGWNSANSGFGSVAEGIEFVSRQLAYGKYYAGKSIQQKLRAYNPAADYTPKIINLMKEISNDPIN